MKVTIEGSKAVAQAVKLARVKVIPCYPITPQTHIMEGTAELIANGDFKAELIDVESEHSSISACVGAQAAGVRTFTTSSSQGLALMHEILFIASGLRLPIVMAVANRALSAPINIWNDHQDSISERDAGWLQFYVESSQEALDTVLMAYKIAENHKVLLPVMVCLDGYTITHTDEQVDIPEQKNVDRLLGNYKPFYKLDTKKPISIGPIAFPNSFMDFRKAQQEAMNNSILVIKEVQKEFAKQFKREYSLIEVYNPNKSKKAVIAMGSVCGTIRHVIDEENENIALIKIRCFRPFPKEDLIKACKNFEAIAVIDRSISPGQSAPVFTEVSSIIKDKKIKSFIAGLGGRDVKIEHIQKISENMSKTSEKEEWLL